MLTGVFGGVHMTKSSQAFYFHFSNFVNYHFVNYHIWKILLTAIFRKDFEKIFYGMPKLRRSRNVDAINFDQDVSKDPEVWLRTYVLKQIACN